MFLQTFDDLKHYDAIFQWAENVTFLIFCAEYALRWTADYLYPGLTKTKYSECCGLCGSSIYSALIPTMSCFSAASR